MNVNWERFRDVINASSSVVLTSHIRPDCDALGSALGMAGILRALGKKVRIVMAQSVPPNLQFIDPRNEIMSIEQGIKPEDLADADLQIIIDTSAWAQLGAMADGIRDSTNKKIIFDHHQGEDDIDAELFKDTSAEAVGRMCVEAAEHLGVTITPEIATPLFAAIATDTGWFRFPSARAVTYNAAARLIEAGADPAAIYNALYERETLGRVRLRGCVLARAQTEMEGRLAHTFVAPEDYRDTGALPTDTEDLVNLLLEIEGTKFAVIFVGQVDGGYKISFRSRCAVACNEVAAKFGGGGHKAAAGAFVDADLDSVSESVLGYVRECLEKEFPTSV